MLHRREPAAVAPDAAGIARVILSLKPPWRGKVQSRKRIRFGQQMPIAIMLVILHIQGGR
jgi:hypothetical protein